jgi:E3 ubiquitin-protein ligase TRIP12
VLVQFCNLIEEKKKLLSSSSSVDVNELVKYNSSKIHEMDLTFTLPGYNDIELKRGSSELILSAKNMEEYVYLVFNKLCITGPMLQIEAFRTGFNRVFSINTLKCFTSQELEEIICGCSHEQWDINTLLENVIANHGYDKHSLIYKGLLNIMIEMNHIEKKQFLLFVTGSPRLPLGGKIFNNFRFQKLNTKVDCSQKATCRPARESGRLFTNCNDLSELS